MSPPLLLLRRALHSMQTEKTRISTIMVVHTYIPHCTRCICSTSTRPDVQDRGALRRRRPVHVILDPHSCGSRLGTDLEPRALDRKLNRSRVRHTPLVPRMAARLDPA
ncbi:hypothetical protein BKA80DRAFT_268270 [Phyllosticta citrichinensis]